MSLTSLIKNHHELKKEFPNLKALLSDQNNRPLNLSDWNIPAVVPSIGKPFEKGIIGTAFDYAARSIVIKALRPEKVTREELLIAEIGQSKFNECAECMMLFPTSNLDIDREREEGLTLVWKNIKEINQFLKERLKSAIEARESFINGNIDLKTMARGAVILARFDEIYRSQSIHIVDEYFRESEGKAYFSQFRSLDNDDLANQVYAMSLLYEDFLGTRRWENAILNPEFGEYSEKVGGADADLIIDKILVDIKTRGQLNYNGDDFAQLFAYAAMAREIGMNIEKVALYYARFGRFISIDLKNPVLPPNFLKDYLQKIIQLSSV